MFQINKLSHKAHFDPLTPKSDWHLISPNHITPVRNIKVMRLKKMITD